MKNVTLDRTTVLQLDADGTDSALDAAADCHVLRNDVALDLCAIVDLEIRGAHLAFDSAEDLRWTIAIDFADDRVLMLTVDSGTLSYNVSGAGPPIVFVAGLGGPGTYRTAQVA